LEIIVNIKEIDGTQMAAKITGDFEIDKNSFPFTAIAFGRIGGQNIGAKLSDETENKIKELGYDIDEVIHELQRNLIQGNLNLPEGLSKESFIDD
jgi:hypothetical protein|tara:strand:- start:7214 stop:7498 length:285 start_codon:yes stop_codon:yes gene_type:complete